MTDADEMEDDLTLDDLRFSFKTELAELVNEYVFGHGLMEIEDAIEMMEDEAAHLKQTLCEDCSINCIKTGNYYMVQDEVWQEAMPKKDGQLCIRCLERRLGRWLVATDFKNIPLNQRFLAEFDNGSVAA